MTEIHGVAAIHQQDVGLVGGIRVFASGESDSSQTTSAADGTYRLGGLPAGDYRLFVEPPEGSVFVGGPYVDGTVGSREEDGTPVTVTETDAAGVDITLVLGFTIHGHVTMARAAAVEALANGPIGGSATVGPNGDFLIQGLPAGEYQVIFRDVVEGPESTGTGTGTYGAYGPGGSLVGQQEAAATIDLTSGDVTLATVHLPRGPTSLARSPTARQGWPVHSWRSAIRQASSGARRRRERPMARSGWSTSRPAPSPSSPASRGG